MHGSLSGVTPAATAYWLGRFTAWLMRHWPWWLRAVLIAFIIAQLAPAQARIPVEPPQTVQTNHPILCMHTRLTDEVESIKIYRTLQMVREMGATAIVEFFPWAYVQPDENIWDWSHPDRIITLAHHQA